MSDIIEKTFGQRGQNDRVCRVAYTLNHSQPILCTIIDDTPLFYFDEDPCDDEMDIGQFEGTALEREIQLLKEEIATYDRYALFSKKDEEKRLQEFSENFTSIENFHTGETSEDINPLLSILEKSRLASAFLELAEKHKITIKKSRQVEDVFYDRRAGTILLNPEMSEEDQILLLSRELRRHWQHRQGALINPLLFHPDNAILVNRLQEADLSASMIRIAWELQLSGNRAIWDRIEDSPMSDLARAYVREANQDFRTINNGTASAAVFEAWFLSERCRQQDKKLVQAMLADYNGYVFEDIQSSRTLTAELISGLGSMPYGKNYLSVHANIIMNDPIFTEVRDRSNANFLWFIKFERSFKETEHELQNGPDLSTHDIRHVVKSQTQDPLHASEPAAKIVQLFGTQETDSKTENSGKPSRRFAKTGKNDRHLQPGKGENIIHLRFGSEE